MINIVIKFLRKLIYSFLIIYCFDLLLKGFNVVVPINFLTLLIVFILGYPGLIMLSLSFFFLL